MHSLSLTRVIAPLALLIATITRPAYAIPNPAKREERVDDREIRSLDVRGVHSLSKRYDNVRFTFFDTGLGACGDTNVASDLVVALTDQMWNGGANCFKWVSISYGGKTTKAQIVDRCMKCGPDGLDFTRGLFDYFASQDLGVIYGSWNYVGAAAPAPPPAPAPKPAPKPAPQPAPKPAPQPAPEKPKAKPPPIDTPAKTTTTPVKEVAKETPSSTKETATSTTVPPAETSAGTPASPIAPPTDLEVFPLLSQLLVHLGGFVIAAHEAGAS